MGMCGSILMVYLVSSKKEQKKGTYYYIFGRIISYTVLGGLLGLFGSAFTISESFKGYMLIFGSIVMALFGLKMLGIINVPKINIFKHKINPGKSMFVVGLLNGLMPCGPLQIMQLYALTSGSLIKGAIIMLIFSIATSISLLILGLTSNKIKFFKSKSFKYIGFIIIAVLSFNMFNQGFIQLKTDEIIGINESKYFSTVINDSVEYQEVTLTVDSSYRFSKNNLKVGIPVKINIDSKLIDGCNNPGKIISPNGEIIEIDFEKTPYIIFFPEKERRLEVICWMNMRFGFIDIKKGA